MRRFFIKHKTALVKFKFVCIVLLFGGLSAFGQTKFIENKGQWPQNVVAKAEFSSGAIWIENKGLTYEFWDKSKLDQFHMHKATDSIVDFHVVRLNFKGANQRPVIEKTGAYETNYNYYIGNDQSKWASGAKAFQQIKLLNVYNSIDLIIDAAQSGFKYSFVVKPGGRYQDIKVEYQGANDVFIDNEKLIALTTLSTIEDDAPFTYLGDYGDEIKSQYALDGNILSFDLQDYTPSGVQDLVIDPSVIFSSLSGSNTDNWGFTATYDEDGNAITGGTVYGTGYPTSTGAFQRTYGGGSISLGRDCGIYKLSPDGVNLIYMTYFGGRGNEQPHSLVVNHKNELIIYGTTTSDDLPNRNAVQKNNGGKHDIFIAKLNATGTALLSATYLGGDGEDGLNGEYRDPNGDFRNSFELVYNYGDLYRGEVMVDSFDNVYIASTTESERFPVTANAIENRYQGGQQDAIVLKLTPNIDTIIWSTFLGGQSHDAAYSLDFDKDYNIYVTGGTKSNDFQTTSGAYDGSQAGGMADAFVSKISADGSTLMASTYLGTNSYEQGFFVKVGPDNKPYVLGQTASSRFPTKSTTNNANQGVFITKMKKDLSDILISKKIGANNIVNISPAAFSVDDCGRVYFSGWGGLNANDNSTGNTRGLTTTSDAVKKTTDGRDFYIAVYTADLATPIYATFYGGNDPNDGSSEHVDGGTSRFDKRGVVYQAICAACNGLELNPQGRFPTYPNNVFGSVADHGSVNCNNAVIKIDLEGPALYAEYERSTIDCQVPQKVTFTNYTQDATDFTWDMGDGTTYTDSNVTHTFTKPGTYIVKLIAYNPIACNLRDTIKEKITIYAKSEADFEADIDVCTREVTFDHIGNYGKTFSWDFGDGNTSTKTAPNHTFADTGSFKVTLFTDAKTGCADTFELEINLEEPLIDFTLELDTCNKLLTTKNNSKGFESFVWHFYNTDTSKTLEPTYQFDTRGQYSVSLTTNLNTSCEDSLVKPVTILDPLADFSFEIDTCNSDVAVINNSLDASGYKWKLSDGRSFTDAAPLIEFTELSKEYTLTLFAAPYSACVDTLAETFRIPGLPKAAFEYLADTCVSAIQFLNKSTDAPSFYWDFGNGDTSKANFPFVNFRDTGWFDVKLIAYPFSDCPDTQLTTVRVDTFRFANFDLEIDTCEFIVEFENTSEDLDSFRWEFGDGSTAAGNTPKHTYNSNGIYEITMFALQTRNGCRDTVNAFIQLPELPQPAVIQTQDSCLNTFIFTDNSNYKIQSLWKSSNGDSLLGNEYKVTFATADSHQVFLIVRSEYDCWDTLITDVVIDSLAYAKFDFELDSCIRTKR
ncbi:MAG: PKD domain-containing protein [Bacteroidia bacterium]